MALVIFDPKIHKKLPRYKQCIVCGLNNDFGLKTWFFTDLEFVYNNIRLNEHYIGYPDRIHGGIVAAIADETMGWSATVNTKLFYYTIELCVKYKKVIQPNMLIYTKAVFETIKGKIAITNAKIFDENDSVIALAKGKYYPLSLSEQRIVESLLTTD